MDLWTELILTHKKLDFKRSVYSGLLHIYIPWGGEENGGGGEEGEEKKIG